MIENIKKFVIRYDVLIVVIILVLIICFLRWWFCSKRQLGENKIKGGSANKTIFSWHGKRFESLGLKIVGADYFIILNEKGREKVVENDEHFKKYSAYIKSITDYNFENDYPSLQNVVKNPMRFFIKGSRSGRAMIMIVPEERKKKNSGKKGLQRGDWIVKKKYFNFEEFLMEDKNKVNEEIAEEIVGCYRELTHFLLEFYGKYVELADYVGQPSICTTKRYPTGVFGRSFEVSPNVSGNVGGILYHSLKSFLREWYNVSDVGSVIKTFAYIKKTEKVEKKTVYEGRKRRKVEERITNYNIVLNLDKNEAKNDKTDFSELNNDLDGMGVGVDGGTDTQQVRDEDGRIITREWDVADIFPSHKFLEMIYFLVGLMDIYIEKNEGKERKDYYFK